MKKRSFLAIMMAGLLFASCDKTNEPNNNVDSGELETSYIAVSVNSVFDPAMRADDGTYDEGEGIEKEISSAHFFFFKANGEKFTLNSENMVGAVCKDNYIIKEKAELGIAGDNMNNVETVTNVMLTIQNNKGEYPAQMLVVLNWNYNEETGLNLNDLNKKLIAEAQMKSNTDFLMSNSAYERNSKVANATPITMDNIGATEAEAKAKPVEVYVERVAAKVTVNVKEGTTDNTFDTGETDANGTKVYAQIVGWDINTTISHSYLVKDIDLTWDNTELGFTWNDEPWYRSYWAKSVPANGEVQYNKDFTWDAVMEDATGNNAGESDYCLENTDENTHTRVVIATKLVDESGNELKIAQLYSQYYTIEGIQNLVANSLKNEFYYQSTTNVNEYISIEPNHITFDADVTEGENSYTVKYVLTDEADDIQWYKYENGAPVAIDATVVNARLAELDRARIWNGMSYYTVDIAHLGGASNLGVVRNHSYVITVEGIQGLGTPVYEGDLQVTEPVKPQETESFVAARINVLSWRIVNQNVTLQ